MLNWSEDIEEGWAMMDDNRRFVHISLNNQEFITIDGGFSCDELIEVSDKGRLIMFQQAKQNILSRKNNA